MSGFGLAPIKREGWSVCYDEMSISLKRLLMKTPLHKVGLGITFKGVDYDRNTVALMKIRLQPFFGSRRHYPEEK